MAFRELPVGNRLCVAASRQRDLESHRTRIISHQPLVDDAPPKTHYLNINRAKKDQLTAEMCEKIDRENRILLRKMTEIIHTHTLDVIGPSYSRSLNEGVRKRERAKIMSENNAILSRITARSAYYHRGEWAQHREKHGAYLQNMKEKPIADPKDPIPLPRFLRDENAALTHRPAHAYVTGNYSVSRKHGFTAYGSTPSVLAYGAGDAASYHSNGSQSARGASAGGVGYTPYAPLTPNRTGQSSHNKPQRVHTLQPMPPQGSKASQARSNANNHSASGHHGDNSHHNQSHQQTHTLHQSPSGVSKMHEAQAIKSGHTPIWQSGRNLGEYFVILSAAEVPAENGQRQEEKTQETGSSASQPSNSTGHLSSLTHATPHSHAILFRSYDPLESDEHCIAVPFDLIHSLPEIHANPGLLAAKERSTLAEKLVERLQLTPGELKFHLGDKPSSSSQLASPAGAGASNAASPTSPVNNAAAVPTPATHPIAYTDSTGVNYYFDEPSGQYLPFPSSQ
jgi:hypothetical protein